VLHQLDLLSHYNVDQMQCDTNISTASVFMLLNDVDWPEVMYVHNAQLSAVTDGFSSYTLRQCNAVGALVKLY
jgi:hypothetical protein